MANPLARHNQAVRDLIEDTPNLRPAAGMMQAIRKEVPNAYGLLPIRAIPDAYQIDHESQHVVLYEIEITSHVTYEKMKRYAGLARELWTWAGWRVALVRIHYDDDESEGIDMLNWDIERRYPHLFTTELRAP